jgi:hypothetical protein
MRRGLIAPMALALLSVAAADEADVVDVEVTCGVESGCDFHVKVRHSDEGWEHYANRWEVCSRPTARCWPRENSRTLTGTSNRSRAHCAASASPRAWIE